MKYHKFIILCTHTHTHTHTHTLVINLKAFFLPPHRHSPTFFFPHIDISIEVIFNLLLFVFMGNIAYPLINYIGNILDICAFVTNLIICVDDLTRCSIEAIDCATLYAVNQLHVKAIFNTRMNKINDQTSVAVVCIPVCKCYSYNSI